MSDSFLLQGVPILTGAAVGAIAGSPVGGIGAIPGAIAGGLLAAGASYPLMKSSAENRQLKEMAAKEDLERAQQGLPLLTTEEKIAKFEQDPVNKKYAEQKAHNQAITETIGSAVDVGILGATALTGGTAAAYTSPVRGALTKALKAGLGTLVSENLEELGTNYLDREIDAARGVTQPTAYETIRDTTTTMLPMSFLMSGGTAYQGYNYQTKLNEFLAQQDQLKSKYQSQNVFEDTDILNPKTGIIVFAF